MLLKTCPVCGYRQSETKNDCAQCGWNYPVMLGSCESVTQTLNERLAKARESWQSNRYQPDSEPELERDPFETWEEFSMCLSSHLWCVGEAELDKNKYDIEASRFDIELHVKPWTKPLGWKATQYWLSLNRDEAKALYLKGTTWPVYVELELVQQKPSIKRVLIFTGEQEIVVAAEEAQVIGQRGNEGRYIDHLDGTVTDTQTGLTWMKPSVGQEWHDGKVKGKPKTMTWSEACQMNGTRFAGYADWRLPTIEELNTLVFSSTGEREAFSDKGVGGACVGNFQTPTIDLEAFPNSRADWFWSSSLNACSNGNAWFVSFDNGGVYNYGSYYGNCVRLVRVGQ